MSTRVKGAQTLQGRHKCNGTRYRQCDKDATVKVWTILGEPVTLCERHLVDAWQTEQLDEDRHY